MKSLYKFAGVIALMCAMTLSTFAANSRPEEPVNFIFSKCVSTCEFKSVSFDETVNEMTITVSDVQAPAGVADWDTLLIRWSAEIVSSSNYEIGHEKCTDASISWQTDGGRKFGEFYAKSMPVKKVVREGNTYTFIFQLSSEQVAFLKSFQGLPGQCKGFSFGSMTSSY